MNRRLTVLADGLEHEFQVLTQWVDGQLWAHWQGRNICLSNLEADSVSSRKTQKGRIRRGRSGDILAPMPGKISKVLVQVESKVEAGQTLIVMEAMKMEYTLKAEVAGTVKSIQIQAGQQVPLGKVLLYLQGDPG